jgi:hypothetical protein
MARGKGEGLQGSLAASLGLTIDLEICYFARLDNGLSACWKRAKLQTKNGDSELHQLMEQRFDRPWPLSGPALQQ